MAVTATNLWTPLRNGDIDPFAFTGLPLCKQMRIPNVGPTFVCTRQVGHGGLHVACYSGRDVCCNSWGVPVEFALPEGF